MQQYGDDINQYVRLTEVSAMADHAVFLAEDIQVDLSIADQQLIGDLQDVVFKLRSYSEPDGSQDYARGVEEGLALAANILERLLEAHQLNMDRE